MYYKVLCTRKLWNNKTMKVSYNEIYFAENYIGVAQVNENLLKIYIENPTNIIDGLFRPNHIGIFKSSSFISLAQLREDRIDKIFL